MSINALQPHRSHASRSQSTGARRWATPSAILMAWAPVLALPNIVLLVFPTNWPRWTLMWTLAVVIYAACKWLSWYRRTVRSAPAWRHVAYLLAWPGMDADAFLNARRKPDRQPRLVDWVFAFGKLALGVGLLWWAVHLAATGFTWHAAWIGVVGVVMSLHFGVFDCLALAWQSAQVDARPLMDWPLASTSLARHWGERWNTAFRDLAFRFVFRPTAGILGPRLALLLVFLVSGLVHELVISVPAASGYGGPTLFFGIQAAGLAGERSTLGRRIGLRRGARGWLWTMLMLLLPLPLLLPPTFMTNVVVPMLQALGAVR